MPGRLFIADDVAPPPLNAEFETCLNTWPDTARRRFEDIRGIVFAVAARAGIGPLFETLKWGQPCWLPQNKQTGSTLRCMWQASDPDRISLYLNCNTRLVETMRTLYPKQFEYEGRRGLHMSLDAPLPRDAVDHCAFLTLTYHRKAA